MTCQLHIVLCCEGDAEVGMGHAVRCAGLLDAVFTHYQVPLFVTLLGSSPALARLFPNARALLRPDWTALDWSAYDLTSVNLVLADIPFYRARNWQRIRHPAAPLAVIDDHGGVVPADLVINGTVLPAYHNYQPPLPSRVCTGPDYALLRPDFAARPWRNSEAGGVTIIAGGGREAREWVLGLAEAISNEGVAGRPVTVVVGSAFDALLPLTALCQRSGLTLRIGLSAVELADLMAGSAALLVTAGMVLYEAVAVGVPVAAYPQIDDLIPEAAWFAARGACLDLGAYGGSPTRALEAVRTLLTDQTLARAMSAQQRALLDGRGMERVAHEIFTLLEAK